MRLAVARKPAARFRKLLPLAVGLALLLSADAAPADDVAGDGIAETGAIPACPLQLGKLRVRTWVQAHEGALSIRFVPENRNFGRCLSLEQLWMEGPTGERLAGRTPPKDWGGFPLRVRKSSSVPAKMEHVSTRDLGVGVGVSIPLGRGGKLSPLEFLFEPARRSDPPLGPGWTWRGMARDTCSETEIEIDLPVDRLDPCDRE